MNLTEAQVEALRRRLGISSPRPLPKSRDPKLIRASIQLLDALRIEAKIAALDFGTTFSDILQVGVSIMVNDARTGAISEMKVRRSHSTQRHCSTSFYLDRELYAKARRLVIQERTTFSSLCEDGLIRAIAGLKCGTIQVAP